MILRNSTHTRPRVLLLIDIWDWAFHSIARAIQTNLHDQFEFTILCSADKPFIDDTLFDIIHVFFETERYHRVFLTGHSKIVKGVYSHYWQLAGQNPQAFYAEYLQEAHAVAVPSMRLFDDLSSIPCPLYVFPEGVDTQLFRPLEHVERTQGIAWAGMDLPIKRLNMLREASEGLIPLHTAINRQLPEHTMPAFFSAASIVACASVAEGCPRPLLEGMACGAFPVTTNVGIVPELIVHQKNGYIVENATPENFRTAFRWCMDHEDILERARIYNRELIRASRQWSSTVCSIADIYSSLLA